MTQQKGDIQIKGLSINEWLSQEDMPLSVACEIMNLTGCVVKGLGNGRAKLVPIIDN